MYDVIFANLLTLQSATDTHGGEQLSPLKLVLGASLVVKLVLLVLAAMGIACWFIIGAKAVRVAQANRSSRRFLDAFWSGEEGQGWDAERLEGVYAQVPSFEHSPIAAVFRAGYVELARVMGSAEAQPGTQADIENVERALRRTTGNEMTALETALPFLATTGSVGPFIGLFGTVWGIMQSFISIHGSGSASLDVVAPGIAEALIATAIGLVAAIPAVMAYNYFLRRIRVLESEIESFSYDYLNIVRRHFLRG